LRENNIRTGFVEREQLERILSFLAEPFRPVVRVAFITGWRLHSELLPLTWKQVDFDRGWLRLEPGSTKNREGREFPLIPELRSILEAQRNGNRWLFPGKRGNHLQSFRPSWDRARRGAGLPGLLIHDLRRSAVRNMIRAGLSPIEAMKLCGWRSFAMLQRYAIVESTMLEEAGAKLQRFFDT
jgi:integrase